MTPNPLLTESLAWMDALWDERAGLLRNPDLGRGNYGDQTTQYMVRETSWYALGLLTRQAPGDAARAVQALASVLGAQYDEPGTVYHGTFYRSPEEPHPPADAVIWKDYDPNWRQFIGTTLALVLWHHEVALPPDLVSGIDTAITQAVHGEPEERVVPSYSNIALMKAWLEVYAGRRYGDTLLAERGEGLAQRVYELFARHGVFQEYNSPTYYGINLYALALWRSRVVSETLLELGTRMEAGLWRDVARYYHADLRNLCSPYDRSYGMDMTRYAAMLGLWVWEALGREVAPFPEVHAPFVHSADFCLAPCVTLLGARIPEDVVPHLRAFQGERRIEQVVQDAPHRVATAWLEPQLMIGAQRTGGTPVIPKQFHPATVHWRTPEGGIGWCRVRYTHGRPVDATASAGEFTLTCNGGNEIVVEISAPNLDTELLRTERWKLPGLVVHVRADTDVEGFSLQQEEGLELRYTLTSTTARLTMTLEPA
jgi:hypothetical protein